MKRSEKLLFLVCIIVVLLGFGLVFGKNLFNKPSEEMAIADDSATVEVVGSSKMPEATGITEEITAGLRVEQNFINEKDSISQLAIVFNKQEWYSRSENVNVIIQLYCEGEELANVTVNTQKIDDQHRYYVDLNKTYTDMLNKNISLVITGGDKDTGLCLMMQENSTSSFKFGNDYIDGTICFTLD